MSESLIPLVAVILGGVLTIAGGYFSTVLVERQRLQREEKNLALAFRGEISAVLQLMDDRKYLERFQTIIEGIEKTDKPFFIPFKVRYDYGTVFHNNADKIGTLEKPLSELVPIFYTRMYSVLEDFNSLGDGTYSSLASQDLLRVYKNTQRVLAILNEYGTEIIGKIDELYGKR